MNNLGYLLFNSVKTFLKAYSAWLNGKSSSLLKYYNLLYSILTSFDPPALFYFYIGLGVLFFFFHYYCLNLFLRIKI